VNLPHGSVNAPNIHRVCCQQPYELVAALARVDQEGFASHLLPSGVSLTELLMHLAKWRLFHYPALFAAIIHALELLHDPTRAHTHTVRLSLEARLDHDGHPAKFFRIVEAEIVDFAAIKADFDSAEGQLEVLRTEFEAKGFGPLVGIALQHPLLGMHFVPFEQLSMAQGLWDGEILPDWKNRLMRRGRTGQEAKEVRLFLNRTEERGKYHLNL
jgi:splicing suppressor protein 51